VSTAELLGELTINACVNACVRACVICKGGLATERPTGEWSGVPMTAMKGPAVRDQEAVLVTAVQRAGNRVGLTRDQLNTLIGSDLTAFRPNDALPNDSAARALKLIRVYECLCVLVGNDNKAMAHWMTTQNHRFGSAPIDLIHARSGLDEMLEYLEWMRSSGGMG